MGRRLHKFELGGAITALAAATLPGVARAEAGASQGDDAGRTALVVAATVAWVLVLALVAVQFLRQRRLARRLDEIETTLAARAHDDNGES